MCAADDFTWIPAWAQNAPLAPCMLSSDRGEGASWYGLQPEADAWDELGTGLRKAHEVLAGMPIYDIIAAISTAAARWTDTTYPRRIQAIHDAAATTGMSPETVAQAFDRELRNFRADELERLIRRELGVVGVLDGFTREDNLGGMSRAIGPGITLGIFSGNVPGLPARSIVRALLLKSSLVAKVASGEPTFAGHFVRSLHDVEPCLGDAIVVTYWDRADEEALGGALGLADAVVAYGSDAACGAIRDKIRTDQIYEEHGHKLSVGMVSARYLEAVGVDEVAELVARDVCAADQHACLSPQAYFVELPIDETRAFCDRVAAAMDTYARDFPPATPAADERLPLRHRRVVDAWRAAAHPDRQLWDGGASGWTVLLDSDLDAISGAGNRVARILPCSNLWSAISALRPFSTYVQNIGLGAVDAEFGALAEELARLGACRITEPGQMLAASMVWHHDGRGRLADMVRWCDVEGYSRTGLGQ